MWMRLPTFRPRAANLMLAVLVLIWVGELVYGRSPGASEDTQVLIDLGGAVRERILAGEYWRLITAMFLHAGPLHIAFNGYALYMFGDQVERFFGWRRFLGIYFVSGLGGSIASFALGPNASVSVGASGAIFGLIGALGAFFFVHRRLLGATARTQLWNAVAVAGLNLVLGISQAGAIDNFAHMGGFAAGIVAALTLTPRYQAGPVIGPEERWLEDRMPAWAPPVIVITLLAVEGLLFALALALMKGLV